MKTRTIEVTCFMGQKEFRAVVRVSAVTYVVDCGEGCTIHLAGCNHLSVVEDYEDVLRKLQRWDS